MSNCLECDANLQKVHDAGSTWNFCSALHCQDLANYNHDFCNCLGQFSHYPYMQNGICMNGPGSLIPIADMACYCCCNCIVADTSIATSKDEVKISHDFNINDMVWVAKDASLKKWMQKPVLFSSGTGANTENRLIKIYFGDRSAGIRVTQKSFVSELVTPKQSGNYYKILSTVPNNFIGKGGLVDQAMVSNADIAAFCELLGVDKSEAGRIYNILNPDSKKLLVPPGQPFLMGDGSLKQADKLVPGKDMLVGEDGSAIPVLSVEAGLFKKGVHHIATSAEKATSLDGHLLLANGVVIGDYATQIGMTTKNSSLEDKYRDHPALGSKEYNEVNTHLMTTSSGAFHKMEEQSNMN
jgi:hypothetical protein